MDLRSLLAFLLWAPGIAAQEVIDFPKAQYPRGRERETIRAELVRAREAGLPARAAVIALSRDASGVITADVFIRGAPGIEEHIGALGGRVHLRVGEWLTARVPLSKVREIARLPGVRGVAIADRLYPETSTMSEIRAASLRRRVDRDAFAGATGQGTIVGFVDSGIDLRHGDFIDDVMGRSRILYLWDQTLDPGANGTPPGAVAGLTFDYGIECRQSQLGANGSCPSRDALGHGTHVAGIAAGDGSGTRSGSTPLYEYVGVAPEADIIAVKTDFFATSIADGVAYIFARAEQLGRPAVVNLSLGSQFGPHDGTDALSLVLDELSGPGRIIVAAAGNEGSNFLLTGSLHGEVTVARGDTAVIDLVIENYPPGGRSDDDVVLVQAFYAPVDSFTVTLQRPDGSRVTVGMGASTSSLSSVGGVLLYNGSARGDTILGDSLVTSSAFPTSATNMFEAFVGEWLAGFTHPSPGTWRLIFHRTGGTGDGLVDAYLPFSTIHTEPYFTTGATNRRLVSRPASATRVVAVAGYNSVPFWRSFDGQNYAFVDMPLVFPTGELLFFSSPGPTRDGRLKPDIAAPGLALSSMSQDRSFGGADGIGGVSPDSAHVVMVGTSMASPHVAGAVALLLSVYQHLTPEQALDALTRGARRDGFTTRPFTGDPNNSPNASWGFGKLDVSASLAIVRTLISDQAEAYNISQNPIRRSPVVIRFNEAPRRVDLYDFAGKRVRTFLSTDFDDARTIRWNLRAQGGGDVVNGVYLLVADLPSGLMRRKVFIVR
jgi:subtilisin family serine protease